MIDDDFTPTLIISVIGIVTLFLVLALPSKTSTTQKETEKQTIIYCVEQPSACKVKYDYYKLENKK